MNKNTDIVCYCKQVDRATIRKAIENGAKTVQDIQKATRACTGVHCARVHPLKVCCSGEVRRMLGEFT